MSSKWLLPSYREVKKKEKKIRRHEFIRKRGVRELLDPPYPLLFIRKDHSFFKDINLRFLHQFPVVISKILVYKFLMKSKKKKDKRGNLAFRPEKISNLAAIFLFMEQYCQIMAPNLPLVVFYMMVSQKVQFGIKLTLL